MLYLFFTRFVTYFAPFAVLFIVSGLTDLTIRAQLAGWFSKSRNRWALVVGLLILLITTQLVRNSVSIQTALADDQKPYYTQAAAWIDKHVEAEQIVFHRLWDSTPFLMYFAPHVRYLVVLDPTFMQAYDADLFDLWLRIGQGLEPDAARLIIQKFGAHWVLVEKPKGGMALLNLAKSDPRFKLCYEDPQAAVFQLAST